jgi:arabinose-5-phosphate isomerase
VTLIVATSHPDSTAGRAADICLSMPPVREACPNELAPTSSTTLQLVLGDALAVALIEARGFSPSDFRVFHPGGKLGAQLTTVGEIMGLGEAIPRVEATSSLSAATLEMSRKRYGCTAVVDGEDRLLGAFTDGDLRRCIAVHDLNDAVGAHMSSNPITVEPETLASDALRVLNENAVSCCSSNRMASWQASSTCTTSCAPEWSERQAVMPGLARGTALSKANGVQGRWPLRYPCSSIGPYPCPLI